MTARIPHPLLVIFIIFIVAALALAACGTNGDDGDTAEAEPEVDAAEEEEEPEDEPDEPEDEPEDEPGIDYPERDITLVVGRSAGGGHDQFANVYAEQMEERLGVNVLLDHQPGAGGVVAAEFMAQQEGDGYTIHIMDPVGLLGYYTATEPDFTFDDFPHELIGTVSARSTTFVVRDESGIADWDDFLERAGSEPITQAIVGFGDPHFLNSMILYSELGLEEPVVIPHDGSAEALTAMLRGDADVKMAAPDSADVTEEGLSPILHFVSDKSLIAHLIPEDVPNGAEVGLEQFDDVLESNLVLTAPPGTDPEVLELLRDLHMDIVTSDYMTSWAQDNARIIVPRDAQQTETSLRAAQDLYAQYRDLLAEYIQ